MHLENSAVGRRSRDPCWRKSPKDAEAANHLAPRPLAVICSSLSLGIDVWVARFVYAYCRPD